MNRTNSVPQVPGSDNELVEAIGDVPCLSDTAASLTEDYTEMAGSLVKLQFDEGEIDFVAAPNLTDAAWEWWEIQGRAVRVETAAEVIAKRMHHSGDRATATSFRYWNPGRAVDSVHHARPPSPGGWIWPDIAKEEWADVGGLRSGHHDQRD